jgi:hypothetical protein
MRRFFVVFLCLLTLASGTIATASAITDLGDPRVTRIWSESADGSAAFTCSATWIRPAKGQVSWLLTAGHCAGATYVKRNVTETILAGIDWRVVVTSHAYADRFLDIAIATAPDLRASRTYHSFFAEKAPEKGIVYIHGFPAGAEQIQVAQVLGKTPIGIALRVVSGQVLPGSSGSVVLDQDGFIVGVLWGLNNQDKSLVYMTPIEAFHDIVKLIGAQFNMASDAE